jgi:hypothetical protein
LVTRLLELPTFVPRPRAIQLVEEFRKTLVKKGFTSVFLNLPQWGEAKIEVCMLERDAPILLREVLESLGKHLSASIH